jgi:pimeloyl-ACP methyl ester carboxylesterase
VASHAWALARVVEHLDGIEEINFVAHSLGNIIVRHYLGDHTDAATHRQGDPRLRRIVMLGPPNQGAIAATALADNELFMAVAGPSGQQLGRDWAALQGRLATPQCEFGIIAGGLGNEHGFNPLLPGDNDFILTVASTRLAGARDFIVVPVVHNLEPHDPRVMQYTLRFLQHGYFKSAAKRHPIAAAAMSKR